jgi:hypothetical protein
MFSILQIILTSILNPKPIFKLEAAIVGGGRHKASNTLVVIHENIEDIKTYKSYKVKENIAKAAASNVWNSSRNILDCAKIGRIAKSIEDINFIMSTFMRNSL